MENTTVNKVLLEAINDIIELIKIDNPMITEKDAYSLREDTLAILLKVRMNEISSNYPRHEWYN